MNGLDLFGVTRNGRVRFSLGRKSTSITFPLHCTGEPFDEMAKAEMPNKLVRSYTGTRFVCGG